MTKRKKILKAYKAFDSSFRCNPTGKDPFQYEVGKSYRTESAVPCKSGFHACVRPLDVFRYYAPAGARFAEVELSGSIETEGDKSCGTEIRIVRELSLQALILEQVRLTTAEAAAGAVPFATADNGAAPASGYAGAATASGVRGAATASGVAGAAMASGYGGRVRGAVGCVLFLVERNGRGEIVACVARKVDGKKVKAMTYYTLRKGKLVAAK